MFRLNWMVVGLVLVVVVGVFDVCESGTLAPPLPPLKGLSASDAAKDRKDDRVRYYSFSSEVESSSDKKSAWSKVDVEGTTTYRPGDPFRVPSLEDIAEIMRKKDPTSGGGGGGGWKKESSPRGGGGWAPERPEHRDLSRDDWGSSERQGDSWGPPRDSWRPPPRDSWGPPPRDRDSWGPPPRDGWGPPQRNSSGPSPPQDQEGRRRPEHSNGWNKPEPNTGWKPQTTVDLPDTGWGWPNPKGSQNNSGGGWSQRETTTWRTPPPQLPPSGGWGHTSTENPRYTPMYLASGEDKYKPIRYTTPIPSGGGWSNRDSSSSVWNSNDKFQSSNGGWGQSSWQGSRGPPSQHNGWGSDKPSSGGWSSNDRPNAGWGNSRDRDRPRNGWQSNDGPRDGWKSNDGPRDGWRSDDDGPRDGWKSNDGPRRDGWQSWSPSRDRQKGWSSKDDDRDSPKKSAFDFRPGVDDLTANIDFFAYEKSDYPPGYKDHVSSHEGSDWPTNPNTFRIVPYTPSPEEVKKILNKRPQKVSNPSDSDETSSFHTKILEKGKDLKTPSEKEKWYERNFSSTTPASPSTSRSTTRPTTNKSGNSNSNSKKTPNETPMSGSSKVMATELPSFKPSSLASKVRPRYDAQGFKYIPIDSENNNNRPVKRLIHGTRDVYTDLGGSKNDANALKESESRYYGRNSKDHRHSRGSRIPLWISDDIHGRPRSSSIDMNKPVDITFSDVVNDMRNEFGRRHRGKKDDEIFDGFRPAFSGSLGNDTSVQVHRQPLTTTVTNSGLNHNASLSTRKCQSFACKRLEDVTSTSVTILVTKQILNTNVMSSTTTPTPNSMGGRKRKPTQNSSNKENQNITYI